FKATPEQALTIRKLAKETAGAKKNRKPPKLSADYRRLLAEVREALADDDQERVESLEDQLEELTITESPEIDDAVELTDAARWHAPEVLRKFRASQVAGFIALHADQIVDPLEQLQEALARVRGWQLAEWQEKRDALGDEIGMLLGGVDRTRFNKMREAVIDL